MEIKDALQSGLSDATIQVESLYNKAWKKNVVYLDIEQPEYDYGDGQVIGLNLSPKDAFDLGELLISGAADRGYNGEENQDSTEALEVLESLADFIDNVFANYDPFYEEEEVKKLKWEEVTYDEKGAGHTYRIPVEGGWLYRTVSYQYPKSDVVAAVATTFVPSV